METEVDESTEGTPPQKEGLPKAQKQVLITVHGTSAGDEEIEGERWWQHGSRFQNALMQRLHLHPNEVEIVPFQWAEGRNSEVQRRVAGRELLGYLIDLEEKNCDYYLIGHSHGGSVIYNTLLLSLRKERPLKRLKHWCTVGTPFLDYRKNRWIWQRLSGMGLTALTTILLILITVCSFYLRDWYVPYTGEHIDLVRIYAKIIGVFSVLALLIMWMIAHPLGLDVGDDGEIEVCFDEDEKRQVEAHYGAVWSGFWHKEDEAISALSNVRNVSMPFIMPEYLQRGFSTVPLGVILFLGVLLAYNTVSGGDWLAQIIIFWSADTQEEGIDPDIWVELIFTLIMFFLLAIVYRFAKPVFKYPFKLVYWLINVFCRLLAHRTNALIRDSIRHSAWGDDLVPEDVYDIGAQPPCFSRCFMPLPGAISEELSKHSEKNAIKTLRKVRQVLGTSDPEGASRDLRAHLSESLSWQELIHTSYFDVPEFVDLMAISLNRAGLGRLVRDGFATDRSERAALAEWFDAQQASTATAVTEGAALAPATT